MHIRTNFYIYCISIFLFACSSGLPSNLKPEEVLQNAASASETLDSSTISYNADIEIRNGTDTVSIKATGDGRVQMGGRIVALYPTVTVRGTMAGSNFSLDAIGDIIVDETSALYTKISTLSIEPKELQDTLNLSTISNDWQVIPANGAIEDTVGKAGGIVPLQSNVLVVEKIISEPSSTDANYKYIVVFDPAALSTASAMLHKTMDEAEREALLAVLDTHTIKGTIVIDATSFYIQSIIWNIQPKTSDVLTAYTGTIEVNFSQFNQAEAIEIPKISTTQSSSTLITQ